LQAPLGDDDARRRVDWDTARRIADNVGMHVVLGHAGRWAAYRLADGSTDNVAYDTEDDARARNASRPSAVLQIPPDGMQYREAQAWLGYWRGLHDGFYRPEPGDLVPLMPLTAADQRRAVRVLTKGPR
jgi:hypothetical protein